MSKPKFSLVTAILVLLLMAAAVNTVLIFHAYDGALNEMEHQPSNVVNTESAPAWHGKASLLKSAGGGYDLIVEAIHNSANANVPATSAEVDIRHPGDSTPVQAPPMTLSSIGKFTTHVDLSPGTWEATVYIHRGFQTLEFSERFDVRN